jgi:hypothetical protein
MREGWVKATANYPYDFGAFKKQLENVPAGGLPTMNAYVLYKAMPQVKKYTRSELIRAMDLLLRCNRQLVSSGLDEALLLQQVLVEVVAQPSVAA